MRTTIVSSTRPITSSATAAPRTVRPSTRVRAPRSLNTRAVMPDAGGRERGAEEEGHVPRLAECEAGDDPEHHRCDHADGRDEHRRLPDRPQLGEAQLESDLEQQQDHPELGEDGE